MEEKWCPIRKGYWICDGHYDGRQDIGPCHWFDGNRCAVLTIAKTLEYLYLAYSK